jgi:hypothetical protein
MPDLFQTGATLSSPLRQGNLIGLFCFGWIWRCGHFCNFRDSSVCLDRRCTAHRGNSLDGSNEPVSAPRERLDKPRVISRVVEGLAKPLDGRVQTLLKVHKCIGRPEFLVKHFACNQFARIFEETDEDPDRLPFQPDLAALFPEFARTQIELEDPELY